MNSHLFHLVTKWWCWSRVQNLRIDYLTCTIQNPEKNWRFFVPLYKGSQIFDYFKIVFLTRIASKLLVNPGKRIEYFLEISIFGSLVGPISGGLIMDYRFNTSKLPIRVKGWRVSESRAPPSLNYSENRKDNAFLNENWMK